MPEEKFLQVVFNNALFGVVAMDDFYANAG